MGRFRNSALLILSCHFRTFLFLSTFYFHRQCVWRRPGARHQSPQPVEGSERRKTGQRWLLQSSENYLYTGENCHPWHWLDSDWDMSPAGQRLQEKSVTNSASGRWPRLAWSSIRSAGALHLPELRQSSAEACMNVRSTDSLLDLAVSETAPETWKQALSNRATCLGFVQWRSRSLAEDRTAGSMDSRCRLERHLYSENVSNWQLCCRQAYSHLYVGLKFNHWILLANFLDFFYS